MYYVDTAYIMMGSKLSCQGSQVTVIHTHWRIEVTLTINWEIDLKVIILWNFNEHSTSVSLHPSMNIS